MYVLYVFSLSLSVESNQFRTLSRFFGEATDAAGVHELKQSLMLTN